MTKEEIFDKHSNILYDLVEDHYSCLVLEDALVAMDEYAKQQAIEFGKWIQGCNYAPATEGNKWQNQIAGENDIVTTEELHDQFIENQNK